VISFTGDSDQLRKNALRCSWQMLCIFCGTLRRHFEPSTPVAKNNQQIANGAMSPISLSVMMRSS
jgi:hypothetical protein